VVRQRIANPLYVGSNPIRTSPGKEGDSPGPGGGSTFVVGSDVTTALGETELQAAIARLTRALAAADDEELVELVAERASLRRELAELRQGGVVVRLGDERARRGR
jgi:hypothetical protein